MGTFPKKGVSPYRHQTAPPFLGEADSTWGSECLHFRMAVPPDRGPEEVPEEGFEVKVTFEKGGVKTPFHLGD